MDYFVRLVLRAREPAGRIHAGFLIYGEERDGSSTGVMAASVTITVGSVLGNALPLSHAVRAKRSASSFPVSAIVGAASVGLISLGAI